MTSITLLAVLLLLVPQQASALSGDTLWTSVEGFYDYVDSNADEMTDLVVDHEREEFYATSAGGLLYWDYGENGTRDLLTARDGLPATQAFGLALADENVWVATPRGLAQVDRATFEVVRTWTSDDGLPARVVTDVAVDGDHLWLGTLSDGILRFDPATGDATTVSTGPGGDRLVRDILVEDDAVWFAADGHGVLRWDRATEDVTRITADDGLATDNVTALATYGNYLWVGTYKGLSYGIPGEAEWTTWNQSNGIPHDRVLDVMMRGSELWVSTHRGVAYLDLQPDDVTDNLRRWTYVDQRSHLRSNSVLGMQAVGPREVWFHTLAGVSRWDLADVTMSHFTNLNGIQHARAAASTVGADDRLWYATPAGVSVFDPFTEEWTNWPFPPDVSAKTRTVYDIAVEDDGQLVWVATQEGFWSFEPEEGTWMKYEDPGDSRTTSDAFLSVEVAGDTVWLAEYDTGLFAFFRGDHTCNPANRDWTLYRYVIDNLLDPMIRDAVPMDNGIWATAGENLQFFDEEECTFTEAYTQSDGLPGRQLGRIVPDGRTLWVLTSDAGIFQFNTETREVEDVYNTTTTDGFPSDAILSATRSGRNLWVGFQDGGIARVDLTTGDVATVDRDAMAAPHALNLVVQDGIVYAGTMYGIQRIDAATLRVLPLLSGASGFGGSGGDGTGSGDGSGGDGSGTAAARMRVYVTSPSNGDLAEETLTVTGRATARGGEVDRVEVRLDDGPWHTAEGTDPWSYAFDLEGVEPGDHRVHARAVRGDNVSDEELVRIKVLPPPNVPLTIDHEPVTEAVAGRGLTLEATVRGDPPLTATLWYRLEGTSTRERVPMTADGDTFTATIPADRMTLGGLEYWIEAESGPRRATSPAATAAPHHVTVRAPEIPALDLTPEPERVIGEPGDVVTFDVRLTNGDETASTYTLRLAGLRASWAEITSDPVVDVPVGGDATRTIEVTIREDAVIGNATLTVVAEPHDDRLDRVRLDVPFEVVEPTVDTSDGDDAVEAETPAPGLVVALAAVAAAVILTRRFES